MVLHVALSCGHYPPLLVTDFPFDKEWDVNREEYKARIVGIIEVFMA